MNSWKFSKMYGSLIFMMRHRRHVDAELLAGVAHPEVAPDLPVHAVVVMLAHADVHTARDVQKLLIVRLAPELAVHVCHPLIVQPDDRHWSKHLRNGDAVVLCPVDTLYTPRCLLRPVVVPRP